MVPRIAELKCYNCGRTWGEVSPTSVRDLSPDRIALPDRAAQHEGLRKPWPRCRRCGGLTYVDAPFTAAPREKTRVGDP